MPYSAEGGAAVSDGIELHPDVNDCLVSGQVNRAFCGAIKELTEAVRALKPAPEPRVFMTAAGPIKVAAAENAEAKLLEEINALKAEVERRDVVIGDLSAELNRERFLRSIQWNRAEGLRAENVELRKGSDMYMADFEELKRFREREPNLEALYDDLAGYQGMLRQFGEPVTAECVEEHLAAVRDFKVST